MNKTAFPRRIYLPPEGRPRWLPQDPTGWELLYLGWGLRWFGESPIPPAMHEGWVYTAILEGAPRSIVNGAARATRQGQVYIFHPDCAYGWQDRPGGCCRMLSWLWRTPPTHSALRPRPGGYKILTLDGPALHHLANLHAACQQEVAHPSELGFLSITKTRLELDIRLVQTLRRSGPASSKCRFNLAIQYLRHNSAELEPVKRLCEYLQVSAATLKNLFQAHCGHSPQAFALGQRMQSARRRIEAGKESIKEIAYGLGYRHPNDFSRAYKRFFGINARADRKSSAGSRTVK